MREFTWRFDFYSLWGSLLFWHWHYMDETIAFFTIHFKRNRELGVHSFGMTILNFRIGFEKDVPVFVDA